MLTLKQSLATLEDLDFAASDSEDERDEDESGEEDDLSPLEDELDFSEDAEELWMLDRQNGLESGELNDLLKDVMSAYKEPISKSGSTAEKPPKKKRKTSSDTAKPNAPVFDLVEPEFTSSKSSALHSQTDARNADAYGEVVSLQHGDAADKSARKRTLRFHTSKIESASARRQGARNQASGGDDDIPYRERRKDKETRLAKEAKTKVRGQGGEDLDDVEPERKVEKRRREDESGDEAEGPDGYYELVKRQTKDKNERKKAEYETATQYVSVSPPVPVSDVLPDLTLMTTTPQVLAPSHEQYWPTKGLLLVGQRASATRVSRNASSSKRRRGRSHRRRQCTRAESPRLDGTMERNLVSQKLSKVCGWGSYSLDVSWYQYPLLCDDDR